MADHLSSFQVEHVLQELTDEQPEHRRQIKWLSSADLSILQRLHFVMVVTVGKQQTK